MLPENRVSSCSDMSIIWMNPAFHPSSFRERDDFFMFKENTWMNCCPWFDVVPLSEEFVDVDAHTVLIDENSKIWMYSHFSRTPEMNEGWD